MKMSTYDFFMHCLKTARQKYEQLVSTPRARAGNLTNEIRAVKEQIKIACDYDEITKDEATYLLREFAKIDFSKLPEERAARKEREKYNVGFKFNR